LYSMPFSFTLIYFVSSTVTTFWQSNCILN
jgi:hypothetical protein